MAARVARRAVHVARLNAVSVVTHFACWPTSTLMSALNRPGIAGDRIP
jgi:hypothetical protein